MIKNLLKKALKLFLFLFIAFVILCIYAYYQMREHINALVAIQKSINEANATSLEKEYGTSDKEKIFNRLILKYLNELEEREANVTH
ncbi:hypothetical protein [Campylobacter helveticus]|uniref:hypothetical protein n=1 Tax=Campylobacter helveticus TaxID=28898 RepID=UPI0022EB38A0|nr:hypothetical protein [Campylobacter helveticus]